MSREESIFLAKKLFTELVFNTAEKEPLKACLIKCIKELDRVSE